MGSGRICSMSFGAGFMKIQLRTFFKSFLFICSASFFTACMSTGVRSSGSELPQAATSFGDGELKVKIAHNCGSRCESLSAKFENLTDTPIEVLVGQSKLKRGASKYELRRVGKERGNVLVPPRSSVSAEFAPYSTADRRRMSYVVPKAVWCSLKIDPACKKTLEPDAQCAGYARGYFTVYREAEGWVILNFSYRSGGRVAMIESPSPQTENFLGPAETPREDDRAPAFFREPDEMVFYKMECNDKCRCKNLTKPRSNSEDGFKPVVEPLP